MKTIRLDIPEGQLTEEVITQLLAKLEKEMAESTLSESSREAARKQADELVAQLRSQGPAIMTARSVLTVVRACMGELEGMPRMIRAIAQTIDTPGHIYELGGSASELIAACGLLSIVERTLQDTIDCDHCIPKPPPSKENLS